MNKHDESFAWGLFQELRKEVIESQKVRAQIIGFKISFITAATAAIAANIQRVPALVFVIPVVASVFFDILTTGYTFSIKRIGAYCREELEPRIKTAWGLPDSFTMWEQFLNDPNHKQKYKFLGNIGITVLAAIPAVWALFTPFKLWISFPLLILMVFLLLMDIIIGFEAQCFGKADEK